MKLIGIIISIIIAIFIFACWAGILIAPEDTVYYLISVFLMVGYIGVKIGSDIKSFYQWYKSKLK